MRQKNIKRKILILPPSPSPLSIKFFATRNFVKHRRVPLRDFSALWDKTFSMEILDIPPLLCINFFATENFLKHSTEGFCETEKSFPTQFFGTVRQQIFYWKSWYSPLRHKTFRYSILSETQKGSSAKWFGTVRQNNFDRKSWYPPPLFSLTFFDTRNFLKHSRVSLRSFLALWHKNFSTESRDTLLHKVQKSVVELMFLKTLWKLNSKQ